jgi:pimeloyl-ACP methyl ester carboxylesterase
MSNDATTPTIDTRTVGTGDDAIAYDIRGDLTTATPERPPLFLFGAPMDAAGFAALAGYFTDRPVITYDPRGAGRNPLGTDDITVEQHVDDLHRVISALEAGPVDAFGNSGGGVTLLALATAHPDDLRRIVAHEPATGAVLPDADVLAAAIDDMKRTYAEKGEGAAMAKFVQLVMRQGELPADYLDQPAPDPAMFGMPTVDDGARTNPLLRNMPSVTSYRPDIDALRALGDRLAIGFGIQSGTTMAARAARAIAATVGIPPIEFPSHHGGFTDQPGMPGDPAGVAARLREVIG